MNMRVTVDWTLTGSTVRLLVARVRATSIDTDPPHAHNVNMHFLAAPDEHIPEAGTYSPVELTSIEGIEGMTLPGMLVDWQAALPKVVDDA